MSKKLTSQFPDLYLEELIHATRVAHEHYEIWWIYKKDRPKYVDIMNDYLGFFRASIQGHFIAMLMALSKIYETRDDTINVKRFVDLVKHNKLIDNAILASVGKSLSRKQGIIKKVFILRNNYFAHRNNELDYSKMLKIANIKYKNFKQLINLSYKILKKISYVYNKRDVSIHCVSKRDTYKLLKALHKKNQN